MFKSKICSNPDCTQKGKLQPIDNFYRRLDKHQAKCKVCIKLYVKILYQVRAGNMKDLRGVKIPFESKYGLPRDRFKMWLKSNHDINMGTLTDNEKDKFVQEYINQIGTIKPVVISDFEKNYGVRIITFRSWLMYHYDMKVSECADSLLIKLTKIYKDSKK